MKKLAVILVIVLLLSGCAETKITRDTIPPNAVYDTTLGVGISLGMEKSKVDELLGASTDKGDGTFTYAGETLYVMYTDGKVSTMSAMSDEGRWMITGGITTKTTVEKAQEITETELDESMLLQYYTKNKRVSKDDDYEYISSILTFNDAVIALFLGSKGDGAEKSTSDILRPSIEEKEACPINVSYAYYSYVFNPLTGIAGIDQLSLELENITTEKVVSTVSFIVEAFDEGGYQIMNENGALSLKMTFDAHIPPEGSIRLDDNRIPGFNGVHSYKMTLDAVTYNTGDSWVSEGDDCSVVMVINGAPSGKASVQNTYIEEFQQKFLNSLREDGIDYEPVEWVYCTNFVEGDNLYRNTFIYPDFEVIALTNGKTGELKKFVGYKTLVFFDDNEKLEKVANALFTAAYTDIDRTNVTTGLNSALESSENEFVSEHYYISAYRGKNPDKISAYLYFES